MPTFKLNEVASRAGVSASTVAHLLKHPEALPGMPEAGSQGRHRQFNTRQATLLSVAAMAVQHGVPVRHLNTVIDLATWIINRVPVGGRETSIIICGGSARTHREDEKGQVWFDLITGRCVHHPPMVAAYVTIRVSRLIATFSLAGD